ncbi:MFS transporter [Nocardioides speluncae]|uniref:MFS transporter n=1 Tax=Nocardioides speluncae TaxID=2670337 RepID=UPI000D68A0B5|nr:MFS transporter [Nocardioides speluncae]
MTQTTPVATHKGLLLALTCAAQFIVVLDIAIVNVALPTIRADLGFTQSGLQWVVVAYGLTLGGFLLLGGRLADHLGRRRILVAGLTIFTGASLLAGTAGQAELLVGARALQGFGAAMIPPAALSILAVTFDEGAERNRALGLYGAVAGISATVGVIASGLLTDGPGWRWIFLINVPIGVALVATALRSLPMDTPSRTREPFDVAGAVTVTGGLLLLVYGLSRGAEHGWASTSTAGLFAGSAALLVAFVVVEIRSRSPLVPATAVRNRTLLAANLSAFFTFGAFFALIFVGTLLMQQVLAYSPTRTGVAWVATSGISFFAAAITGGKLAEAWGVRRVLVGGLTLLATAMVLLARVPADAGYAADLLPAFLLAGIAVGAAAPAAQIGALAGVDGAMTGLASGLVETSREIGGAVGVAAVSTVLIAQTGLDGLHAAIWVIFTIATLGAVTALLGFPREARVTDALPTRDAVSR